MLLSQRSVHCKVKNFSAVVLLFKGLTTLSAAFASAAGDSFEKEKI
jgi:hypothetical protein